MLRRSFEYNYQISNKIKTKQSKAKQSKAKQSKAKQNKAKQMKTPRTPIKKVYKIKRISTNDLKKLQNMFRSITNIVQIS